MAKKSGILKGHFQRVDPYGTKARAQGLTVEQLAQQGLTELELTKIMPDPQQPRRLMPEDQYARLYQGQDDAVDVMANWLAGASSPTAGRAYKEAVAELETLAATIEWRGLINPITVRPVGKTDRLPTHVQYVIITGERRWWSHVYLSLSGRQVDGQDAHKILARVEEGDIKVRADQWIENQARSDLSALEKAYGLESIRQELSRGQKKLVPWSEVERVVGIHRNHRGRMVKVLQLSDEAKILVARHNLTERAIRPVVERLLDRPDLQVLVLQQLIIWQENGEESSNRRLTGLIDSQIQPKSATKKSTKKNSQPTFVRQFGRGVDKTLQSLDSLNDAQRLQLTEVVSHDNEVRSAVESLRDQLNRLLE